MAIRAEAELGKVKIFLGTDSDVRDNYSRKFSVDVTSGLIRNYYFRLPETSRVYVGIRLTNSYVSCRIRYTFANCTQAALIPGRAYSVPALGQNCFYVFKTPKKVDAGEGARGDGAGIGYWVV